MKRIAVVAHYDVDGLIDPYLARLLSQLAKACERIVLVTTSGAEDTNGILPGNVEVIERPNIGYDFCSFRRGIEDIESLEQYDQLLVLNDSFYCSEKFDLQTLLDACH